MDSGIPSPLPILATCILRPGLWTGHRVAGVFITITLIITITMFVTNNMNMITITIIIISIIITNVSMCIIIIIINNIIIIVIIISSSSSIIMFAHPPLFVSLSLASRHTHTDVCEQDPPPESETFPRSFHTGREIHERGARLLLLCSPISFQRAKSEGGRGAAPAAGSHGQGSRQWNVCNNNRP